MPSHRIPSFISPSALGLWLSNKEEYFLKYCATDRPPRIPQNNAMSVGSGFDAYVKSHLASIFDPTNPQFEFTTIFETQVEPQNRDFALAAGRKCFDVYKSSGALDSLIELLHSSTVPPKMETTEVTRSLGVPMLGKPDLIFTTKTGFLVIFDWKVNGYCSAWGKGPTQGYVELRDGSVKKGPHKDATLWSEHGITYNTTPNIEQEDKSWARQLATYSWMAGKNVGDEMIVFVDQLACGPKGIRIAHHRSIISESFQKQTHNQYLDLWEAINSDHVFRELSKDDSEARVQVLNAQGQMFNSDNPNDKWLKEILRGG